YKDQNTAAPAVVEFRDESANAVTYRWLIKNVTSTDKNATVTFTQAGTYPVSLTVSNAQGESTFTDTVTITPNSNPLAGFSLAFHPFPYTVNEAIQLVNTSKNSDAWEWTFGANGPAPSTEQHPEVKFTAAGDYTIKLIAKKGTLVSAPKSITIRINP
ncbi:MAG: PKD domain-containing protein, partial [Sphingobacteriales bacterium]